MKGKIEIEAVQNMGVAVKVNIQKASLFDILGVFEALTEALKLDDDDRKRIGLIFMMGGINNMPGVKTAKVEMDEELLQIFKAMKENNNETDAL